MLQLINFRVNIFEKKNACFFKTKRKKFKTYQKNIDRKIKTNKKKSYMVIKLNKKAKKSNTPTASLQAVEKNRKKNLPQKIKLTKFSLNVLLLIVLKS